MTGPPRSAAASMAAVGVSALLAAIAVAGWNPGRNLYRAAAAHPHRAGACTHGGRTHSRRHAGRTHSRRHAQRTHTAERGRGAAPGRGAARPRAGTPCPKRSRHHAVNPQRQAGPQGSSTPAGSTGSTGSGLVPASPGGSGSTAPNQPGSGESTPPPSLPEVQVSAVEYHFTLSRTTVPAGKVILQFVNDGQDEHNLNAQGAEGPPAATFAIELPKAVTKQVVELHHGSYTLFCSLAGHAAKGMKATLTVE